MKDIVEKALKKVLAELGLADTAGVVAEYSDEEGRGDIATNAALVGAKALGMQPRELAEKLLTIIESIPDVERAEIAGPGFINIYLKTEVLMDTIAQANQAQWGSNTLQQGKRVMVEYTDPNPFKEFHIGHLMSNAIGESIARITEYTGAEVKRANYQGDVGPHVAKAIWGKQQQPELAWGAAYAYGAKQYEENEEAKEQILTINRKVYDRSDEEINRLYDQGRKESLEHFEDLYAKLGTKFDFYFFESETAPIGVELVRQHTDVFEESDGAIVYKGEQDGLHTRVFITSNGLPTYEAKDLGLLKVKAEEWPMDTSIYVTANEQAEYFKVMIAAARRFMPELAEKAIHITHGMMRLPSGKMSSRTGDVITGESLLLELTDAARERAKESKADDVETLASDIAVAAIKYQILKQGIGKDIIFEKERALSLEGDSGPYLQYAYARTKSIEAAAHEAHVEPRADTPASDGERSVALYLDRFPSVVARAQAEYEPHHIATYATALAALYNSWYAAERVLDSDRASERLALTMAVGNTLQECLHLLGVPSPERM